MTSQNRDFRGFTVKAPPHVDDVRLAQWQRDVADQLNAIPKFSVFSAAHPESVLTAALGTLAFNAGAASSDTSVLWIKQVGSGSTGWAALG